MIDTDRITIHAKGPLIPILQISPTKYLQFSWPSKITDYVPYSTCRYHLDLPSVSWLSQSFRSLISADNDLPITALPAIR
jgi:hypothetical protein